MKWNVGRTRLNLLRSWFDQNQQQFHSRRNFTAVFRAWASCLHSPLRVSVKALQLQPGRARLVTGAETRALYTESALRLSGAPGPMFGSLVTISMEMLH